MNEKWKSEEIFNSITNFDNIVTVLTFLCDLRDKIYEDNQAINDTIDIVRNYACGLFGGSINKKSDE